MMYTLKGWRATATLLLFSSLCRGDPLGRQRQPQQRYSSDPAMPLFPRHLAPPWEYMLREMILKSITPPPSPLDTSMPHKRPLDASFYGGPLATHSNNDTNVVLSRGNVYRLLNGHWMLCQDGCVDCEPCAAQRDPSFKWALRRVQRQPSADPPRHELQLTITPQMDERLHASDFWPNSYVYVMSRGDVQRRASSTVSVVTPPRDGGLSVPENSTPAGLEDSLSTQHHRSRNPWRLAERDSTASRDDDRATTRESASSTEEAEKPESPEQKQIPRNVRLEYRPRARATENPEETDRLVPKLILGIDRRGQKHLVHVIPVDQPSTIITNYLVPSQLINQTMRRNDIMIPKRERQSYQQIFRRVFDSLNTHRRSIQNFLEADNTGRHRWTPPAVDGNMDIARDTWNNRGINHTIANFAPLRGDTPLSPFYEDRTDERQRQYRGRYGYEDTKQNVNDYYARYRHTNYTGISRGRSPMNFEERQKLLSFKPYFTSSRILGTSPSISQTRGNFSADADPRSGFSNSFVNGTLIGKANNNSIVPSGPITTRRGNSQLFRPERLKSGDANREFEASHHPSRIIVTAESPVIRGEHETVNHT